MASRGGADFHPFPFNPNLAGVRAIDAVEDVHEGDFSCAVFAQKGVNFAGLDIEVHLVVSQNSGKDLVIWRRDTRVGLAVGAKLLGAGPTIVL